MKTPYVKQITVMGTSLTVTNYTPGKAVKRAVDKSVDIAKKYDKWTTVNQAGSIVDKINKNAGVKPVKVSNGVFKLVKAAYDLSDQKTGYDVTVGPLTQLWHIGFPDAKVPTQAEINAVKPLISYKFLKLNASADTVYLTKKGSQLDLGSITKGYVVKLMTAYLKAQGMTDGIVDLGSSSLYIMGHSPRGVGKPWTVALKDPNHPDSQNIGVVTAEDSYVSTSGIYERYIKKDGHTYSHILNPATGYPFDNDIQGVTIVGKNSATYGDGVTTTMFALGTEKGYQYALKHHLKAVFIDKGNRVYVTPNLQKDFTLNSKSGYHLAKMQ